MGDLVMKTKGLTLTEIMVSVSIVGLMAATAIPAVTNFRETAYETICHKNLQAIDNAKLQWAITEEEPDDAEPTEEDMAGYIRGDFPQPVIAGALYDINDVVTPALCTFHGNSLVTSSLMHFMPDSIINLVNNGNVTASEVIEGNWYWNHWTGQFDLYDLSEEQSNSVLVDEFGDNWREPVTIETTLVDFDSDNKKSADLAAQSSYPEITIDGKTIKGESITRYSEAYIEANRDNMEKNLEHNSLPSTRDIFMLQMTGGGYEVSRSSVEGCGLGLSRSHDTLSNEKVDYEREYYDSKGNTVGYSLQCGINGDLSNGYNERFYDANGNLRQENKCPIVGDGSSIKTYNAAGNLVISNVNGSFTKNFYNDNGSLSYQVYRDPNVMIYYIKKHFDQYGNITHEETLQ